MTKRLFPPGARVLVDGRDEARVRQAFPEGSGSYLWPHYKLDFIGGDKNVAVAMSRVGVARRPNASLGPGKFGNTLTRAIYELSLDGGADEEADDVSEVGMWAGMIQSPTSILHALEREPDHLGATAEDLSQLRRMRGGGVIITEDEQGFVGLDIYADDKALLEAWDELARDIDPARNDPDYESNARAGAPPDQHAADELVLYAENTYELWGAPNSQHISIVKNLMRKRKKGTYNAALSVKLWGYLAETAAKRYVKEMHSSLPWHEMFNTATRKLVAEEWAKDFREKADAGEFDHIDLRIGH